MSALDDLLKKHRKQIIEREEKTFREMLAAYEEIEKDLVKSYDKLQKQINEATTSGEEISPSWFFRQKRLKNLLAQVQEQINRFGETATRIIEREQRAAIQIGIRQAQETFNLEISSADFPTRNFASTLNPRTVETAVGMMGDGSPIREYFTKQLAPAVAEKIRSEVVKAAAMGTDFKTVARRLRETGDITKRRSLSVARTEVNRVRRESVRQIYEENDDIVIAWIWVASKSLRTCPLCLAMDGREFPLAEPFPQHINCRCTMRAKIDGIEPKKRITGKEYFENLSDEDKEKILGKEAFLAYRDNNLTLNDFIAFRNDKRFGKSVTRKPLAKILADSKERNISRGILGKRENREVVLDDEQIKFIKKEFKVIGGNPNILTFNVGRRTGFIEEAGIIRIKGDILPIKNAAHPRSRMSIRAVLSHELQHQKNNPAKYPAGDWRDEFRASFLAALRTPNLTKQERYDLMEDAIRRAEEAGQVIRKTKRMREILGLR